MTSCEEGVVRRGLDAPCDRRAVALRVDVEGGPYPVCARHVRVPMVCLDDLVVAASRSPELGGRPLSPIGLAALLIRVNDERTAHEAAR